MSARPQDNPLNYVKVEMPGDLFLGSKIEYWLLHGTLEGWKRPAKLESIKERNNRDVKI